MTEFPIEGRQYCRNPKCRMKLAKPAVNERNAFCAAGCKRQFYRFRCFVCEEPMERKTEEALICGKRKCHAGLDALRRLSGYEPPWQARALSKKPVYKGFYPPAERDRGIGWAIAANSARIRAPRRVLDAVFGHIQGAVP
ncbi:MAG TPA: hypothetical protein VGH29_20025 [Candidatus Binataceae bacterium]|jgi:hypothetical protein